MEGRGELDDGEQRVAETSHQKDQEGDERDEEFWKKNEDAEAAFYVAINLLGTKKRIISPLSCLFLMKKALDLPHLDLQIVKRKLDSLDFKSISNIQNFKGNFNFDEKKLDRLRLNLLGIFVQGGEFDSFESASLSSDDIGKEQEKLPSNVNQKQKKFPVDTSESVGSSVETYQHDKSPKPTSLEEMREKSKSLESFLSELSTSTKVIQKLEWDAFTLHHQTTGMVKEGNGVDRHQAKVSQDFESLRRRFDSFSSKLKRDVGRFLEPVEERDRSPKNTLQPINWTMREESESDRKKRRMEEEMKREQPHWNIRYRNLDSRGNEIEKSSPLGKSHENLPSPSMLMRQEMPTYPVYSTPYATVQTLSTTTRNSILDNLRLLPVPIGGGSHFSTPLSPQTYPAFPPPQSPMGVYNSPPSMYREMHYPPPAVPQMPVPGNPNVMTPSDWKATPEEVREDKNQEKKLSQSGSISNVGRELPGPPGGGGFYIRIQPNPNQRKCYPQEKRYIMPNPIVVSWKSGLFRGKGMVKVSLVNQLGEQSKRMQEKGSLLCFPDNELERVIRPDGIAEFCLKVTINCLSDEKFRLMFTARYELDDEPMIVHTQQLFSEPFEVQNNKSYNYKKSRKEQQQHLHA